MDTWTLIILACCFQTTSLLALLWRNNFNVFNQLNVYSCFYWACFVLGPLLAYLIYKVSGSYKLDEAVVLRTVVISASCYYVSLFSYWFAGIILEEKKLKILPSIGDREYDVIASSMFVVSLIAISIYVLKNHGFVLFKEGGYENRYQSNVGLGALSILFQLYIPGALFFFLKNSSMIRFVVSLFIVVLFGSLIYVALGGYRQLALGGLLIMMLTAYSRRVINRKVLLFCLPLSLFLLMALATLRYKNFSSIIENDAFWTIFLYYLVDSIAPFDSFANILQSVTRPHQYQFLDLITNHFARLIPRFVWTDKPDLIMNSGNYYTQKILQYDFDVTISPTLNGELYLACGLFGLIFGMFVVGILIKLLDAIDKKQKSHQVYLFMNFFITFWLVREGLEVFLERLWVAWILLIIFAYLSATLSSFLNTTETN